jgi:hypothetical protein
MTFPEKLADREAYILEQVKAGFYEAEWVPVTSTAGDLHAVFWVMGDALKVEDVRVNVSATLEQQIADVVGGMLMTGKVADLVFAQAQLRVGPYPRPITSSTTAMIEHSEKISAAVDALTPLGENCMGKLVSSAGKDWILDKKLEVSPGRACNYGWHFLGTSYQGIKGYPSVTLAKDAATLKPISVIQPNATAHDPKHTDYSQTCRLMSQFCEVNGVRRLTEELLSDAALVALISHDGVLKNSRQPGVPVPENMEIVMPQDKIFGN